MTIRLCTRHAKNLASILRTQEASLLDAVSEMIEENVGHDTTVVRETTRHAVHLGNVATLVSDHDCIDDDDQRLVINELRRMAEMRRKEADLAEEQGRVDDMQRYTAQQVMCSDLARYIGRM